MRIKGTAQNVILEAEFFNDDNVTAESKAYLFEARSRANRFSIEAMIKFLFFGISIFN